MLALPSEYPWAVKPTGMCLYDSRLYDDDACWSCDDDDLAVFSIEGDVKRQRAKDDRQHNNASQWTSDA